MQKPKINYQDDPDNKYDDKDALYFYYKSPTKKKLSNII